MMKAVYFALLLGAGLTAFALSRSGGANSGVDEFGTTVTLQGTVWEHPYGYLVLPEPDDSGHRVFFLTSTAKSDVADKISGLDGQITWLVPDEDLVIVRFGHLNQLLHTTAYQVTRFEVG